MEPLPEHFDTVAATVIRQALLERKVVRLPGLGKLKVVHHKSRREPGPDGKIYLLPPADRVIFESES
ncbi:MAG: HU family DNA-binding protein [Bacteroidetes bacterium]|nr:HU family DNA-binding protein [Rhodothermia bacterium]MCS7155083.1 HU family DNA-binding protein [Bacteroidota bacterium]MCX7907189.1 HU family DNA-binding protein [Bacteroidota bacterium]MDW8138740.1 hypothetical protein [Bacteroidota bacterium]MDW8286075.1 hypothetical protein [Bacteroidota bacterium]